MQFLYPSLTIGFALVAIPLLVHLINMLRHRRQRWAAMEFLLLSYRKQRKWVWLRQLALLLARTAAVAILVAMLAGWVSGGRWLDAFGGRATHHVVVLDDSFSMADRSGGETAYSRALTALGALVDRLAEAEGTHQLTVLRTSRAALVRRAGSEAGDAAADLSGRTITAEERATTAVFNTRPTATDDGPEAALQLAAGLAESTAADETLLYVLSDFRTRQWENPQRAAELLESAGDAVTETRLVDCAVPPINNLAVVDLRPTADVWAAGVPVMMEARIRNYSDAPATNVALSVASIRYGSGVAVPQPDRTVSGDEETLPEIVIDSIAPGEDVTEQFQVYLAEPGTHAVRVRLPDDAVATDNQRACTLPLSEGQRVLLVDGDPDERNAYLMRAALDPGGSVNTGLVVDVRSPSFLTTAPVDQLREYATIYLLDVPQLDAATTSALEQYAHDGGGVAIWLGDAASRGEYNDRLWRDGEGMLPGRLGDVRAIDREPRDDSAGELRLAAAAHPLTMPLRPVGDSAFSRVRVRRHVEVAPSRDAARPAVAVLSLRGGEPWAIERPFGDGRVLLVLGGMQRTWTNWPGDPTFVVFALRTAAHLGSGSRGATDAPVARPLAVAEPRSGFARTADYLPPTDSPPRTSVRLQGEREGDEGPLVWTVDPAVAAVEGGDVEPLLEPGIGEFWLTDVDGREVARPIAVVVDASEGDLRRTSQRELLRALEPLPVRYVEAGELAAAAEGAGLWNRAMLLLAVLAVLLVVEQLLAYSASYHPPVAAEGAV